MYNDLISRKALKEVIEEKVTYIDRDSVDKIINLIDNAPTVEEVSVIEFKEPLPLVKAQKIVKALSKRPQDEMIETKHRLNLLIGVLYSNQLISKSDLEYIEDSIKKLMSGGADMGSQNEWICPNCDLYDPEEGDGDYCQYAGKCTLGCHECRYFKQKGGAE